MWQPLSFHFKSSSRLAADIRGNLQRSGAASPAAWWDARRERPIARAAPSAREPTQGQRVTATDGHRFSDAGSTGVARSQQRPEVRSAEEQTGARAGQTCCWRDGTRPGAGGVRSGARAFGSVWLLGAVRVDAPVPACTLGYGVKTRFFFSSVFSASWISPLKPLSFVFWFAFLGNL